MNDLRGRRTGPAGEGSSGGAAHVTPSQTEAVLHKLLDTVSGHLDGGSGDYAAVESIYASADPAVAPQSGGSAHRQSWRSLCRLSHHIGYCKHRTIDVLRSWVRVGLRRSRSRVCASLLFTSLLFVLVTTSQHTQNTVFPCRSAQGGRQPGALAAAQEDGPHLSRIGHAHSHEPHE